jgi:hypothetical protein
VVAFRCRFLALGRQIRTSEALALTTLAAAFVIGFLLGNRRAVRQCNSILDEHCTTLTKAMMDGPPAEPIKPDEALPAAPTMH